MNVVIRAHKLSKRYKVLQRSALSLRNLLRRKELRTEFQALENVSFEVTRGECVGVIGRNGAGKSTLLKILAGTLEKTEGNLDIKGKISAILELGSGFNPEYSGRENIVMGGLCLGMSQREIESRLDQIIDISELRSVIDRPFKTYSSGMQARLTFSTAISIEPDILIVDEALATGDIAFVEKCLLRIEEIVRSGVTVLLVSHNTNMITRFAKRAIWIDKGRIAMDGPAETVIKKYEIECYKCQLDQKSELESRFGDQKVQILGCRIIGREIEENVFVQGSPMDLEIDLNSKVDLENISLRLQIHSVGGSLIWSATSGRHMSSDYVDEKLKLNLASGLTCVRVTLPRVLLNSGPHYLTLILAPSEDVHSQNEFYDYKPKLRNFAIVREDSYILNKVFDSPSRWEVLEGAAELAVKS